jgi:hypothetical protein
MRRGKGSGFVLLMGLMVLRSDISFSAATTEEVMQQLNEQRSIIERQQKEIEGIRQQLKNQEKTVNPVQEPQEEETKAATKENIKETIPDAGIPKWTDNIRISGDLRLRYEGLYNREQRQPDGSAVDLPDRHRYRIRARLFFEAKMTDEISTHFMLCTNQDSNLEATTTNQSFTDDFNDKGIYLHQAYATYKPSRLNGLEVTAGKFKNTFLHTDIMWDPDVNPEGIYERYQCNSWGAFQPFIHLGQMAVNEEDLQSDDAALYINQLGFDWEIGQVKWTLAGSYYDWANLHNSEFLHKAEYKGGGGNTFRLDGDGVLQYLYDYNLMEGISFIKFKLSTQPIKLIFDYIVNTADYVQSDHDTAFFAGFKVGEEKEKGDWSLSYKYARIETDAVIGSMNDQDFYGSNRKGHKVTFGYILFEGVGVGTAFFYTDPVTAWKPGGVTFDKNKNREHEDRLQIDFLFNF